MAIEHEDVTSVHRGGYVSSSDPGAVGAYVFWTDTTTTPYLLKVRNAGNTAWTVVGFVPTGANVGATGEGIFKEVSGQELRFKKIKSADGSVTVTSDTNNVDLAVSVSGVSISSLSGNLPHTRISVTTPAGLVGKPTVGAGVATNVELGDGLEFNSGLLRVVGWTNIATLAGGTFTGDITVPAEAYGVGWNGSNEVPTKNDVYDTIESFKTAQAYTETNVTPSRTFDADTVVIADLADVVGTLIADLRAAGIID